MISQFLKTRYVRGGRGPDEYDCWGITRDGWKLIFGKPVLPILLDAKPGDLRSITNAHSKVADLLEFKIVQPRPGSIATAWMASLCVHVGLVVNVDGRMFILETDESTGPCLTAIKRFESRYSRVEFYDN